MSDNHQGDGKKFALTAIQKGLLAESLVTTDKGLNVEQVVWQLDFVPDAARFRAAWQHAIDDFDALRLRFAWPKSNKEPLQEVLERVTLPFREQSLVDGPASEQDARLERFLERDRSEGFDLLSGPLMRVSLLELDPSRAVCVWTIHHCIIDGRSYALVLSRVLSRYASREAEAATAGALAPSFREFLRWLGQRDASNGAQHFARLLDGFGEATALPLQPAARASQGHTQRVELGLDALATKTLREAASAADATPNTLVQLAWALLLANYSGQDDVVFGATWSGRAGTIELAEQVVGPFISTLPVRVQLGTADTVRELVQALRSQHLGIRPVIHTSLAEIKAGSGLARAAHLFETLVVFDRKSLQTELRDADPSWQSQRVSSRSQTGYPLVLAARLEAESLELELEFDIGLYDRAQAQRLLSDYSRLLTGLCADLDQPAGGVPMLAPELLHELTTLEAQRELAPPWPAAVVRVLEQARRTPQQLAIRQLDGQELSYAELLPRVLGLATVLRAKGVGPGVLVAVWLPRSIGSIVALLAVHAAGGVFVPLDTQSPLQRVEHVVRDSKAALLLVNAATRGRLAVELVTELDVDQLELPQSWLLESEPAPESPAYVIYTSGSTGLPKGVVVPHSALANHLAATLALFELGPSDRVLQFTTPTFDVALEEILPTLAAGATLVLRDEPMISSARSFFDAVAAERLSVINLPTAFWHQLVHAEHLSWPDCLRLVVVGGERASAQSHARFREAVPSRVRWLNAYGPTEATITSTSYDDAEGDHGPDGVPIGRPLPGISHFVLNEQLRPVPPGSVGKLYIGGAGLALGYLFRDELTARNFIPHPWRAGARLYASGDRVRKTAAGNYVYVDRPDNQVKLRGFRIELGEIEAQLRRHPAVREAVVVVSEQAAGKLLIAFVIADQREVSEDDLREHLAAALPAHMLPSQLVLASSLPTTLSGKVDRRALSAQRLERARPSSIPPPPSTRRGSGAWVPQLMAIWSEVLGVPVTSTSASFFDLGGHSLLAVRMFTELEQRLGRPCNVAAFFRNPTIAHLAELLSDTKGRERASVMQLSSGSSSVPPLFFAPGLTGRAVDFVHLASAISRDVPVHALELHAFADADRPDETLSDAVRALVDLMRRVQPRGPYSVAGFSAGGTFAVAIANELHARGETTDFVGLIDSVPPTCVPIPSPLTSPKRLARLSKTVVGRVQEILEQPQPLPLLLSRTAAAAKRSVARWHGLWFKHRPTIDDIFGEMPQFSAQDVESMQRYLDAVVGHHFGQLSLELVLFRVPLDPPEGPYEQDLGWRRVTNGSVTIEQVAGRHGDLMTAAGCEELAARFNAYLSRRRPM